MEGEVMKERPILFNGEMVRAILDGRKSQTRRIIKPPRKNQRIDHASGTAWLDGFWGWQSIQAHINAGHLPCPYGEPGDRLWVRETWATTGQAGDHPDDIAPDNRAP